MTDTYMSNRANKRRSLDAVHFELHWERDIVRLLADFNERSLVPFLYAFINSKPRDREVVAGLMQMKILQEYFDRLVRPLVEQRFTPCTFNNRIGYGSDKALAKVRDDIRRVSRNYTRDCYIIQRDIRAFFPSTELERSYNRYRDLIYECFTDGEQRDDLLYILQRVVYAYPQHHAVLRSPLPRWDEVRERGKSVVFNRDLSRGACLGNQFWQVEKNFDLAEFDRRQAEMGMHYTRYVDDMVWIVENLAAGLAYVAQCEKELSDEFGYEMHKRKRYTQHYSKGLKFLGAPIKYDRIYASSRSIRNAHRSVHRWNSCHASQALLGHFLNSVNSYLGIFKNRTAYGQIRDLADVVSKQWLEYCHYDDDRGCFVANEEHSHNEILIRKYHFKIRKYDKRRNRRAHQRAGVSHP